MRTGAPGEIAALGSGSGTLFPDLPPGERSDIPCEGGLIVVVCFKPEVSIELPGEVIHSWESAPWGELVHLL